MVLSHYHPYRFTCNTSKCLPALPASCGLVVPGIKPLKRSRGCIRPLHICTASSGDARNKDVEIVMETPEELHKGINLPRRGARKKRKLLLLAVIAGIEYLATSAVVWSPLIVGVGIIAFAPSDKDLKVEEDEYVERARRMASLDYWRKLPLTPKEPAEWLNRLAQGLWGGYVQQFVLANNLGLWQEKIADLSPDNWSIQFRDFELGDTAPTISDVQVFNDSGKAGKFSAMDMAVKFDTGTLSVTAEGVGPVGSFTLCVSGVTMMGNMRVLPVFEHRMLLYSFKEPPRLNLKLGVKGPAIGKLEVPQFDFVKRAVKLAISDLMVEPNRGCISLDYEPIGRRAIDVECKIEVVSIEGVDLPVSVTKSKSQIAGICINIVNSATKTRRRTSTAPLSNGKAYFGEKILINLGDMAGVIDFEVCAVGKNGKKVGSKAMGRYRMNVAHMGDGSTGFWTLDRDWNPIAYRWNDKLPWETSIPVRGMASAKVQMKFSMGEWTYMQPYAPLVYRSKGERTIVLQVVEARDLVPKDIGGTSDPYVKFNYNSRSYKSHTIFKTTDPIWGDTFVFSENSSLVSKRIRGEVWDKDFTSADDREGFFFVDLNLASEGEITDRWFQLSGEESGEVRIRFTILPGMKNSQSVKSFVSDMKATLVKTNVPTITVNVWGAKNLKPMDMNGLSDPFCEIRYGDLEQVTPVIQTSLNPTWDFSARFPYDPTVSTVKIECLDKDTIQLRRKSMGSVTLNLPELVSGETDSWDAWVPIQEGGRGEINVGLVKTPADEDLMSMDVRLPKSKIETEGSSSNGTKVATAVQENGSAKVYQDDKETLNSVDDFMRGASQQVDGFVQSLKKFWSD